MIVMITLNLPWYNNDQARYQADVLKFLQQTPDAAAMEWASITLHIAGARGGAAKRTVRFQAALRWGADRMAVVVAGAIIAGLQAQPGPPTFSGVTVRFYDAPILTAA
jgi:hypothetical protein